MKESHNNTYSIEDDLVNTFLFIRFDGKEHMITFDDESLITEDYIDEWHSFQLKTETERKEYDVHVYREHPWDAVDVLVYPTKMENGNIVTDTSTWTKLKRL